MTKLKVHQKKFEDRIRSIAKVDARISEGELELDDKPLVSADYSDGMPGGAYVQTWLWIEDAT